MKISVVTPSFNQGVFIEHTINSVLSQDSVDLEYIVVDGVSTDGTQEILERYRCRLSQLIIEPDRGQADALRKGFGVATGDVLCYLNSDDVFLPGALQKVVLAFQKHPDVDVIYGNRLFIDAKGKITRSWILPPHSDYLMSRWDFIPQENCFWRREAMSRVGGIDPSYQFAMDYDLFTRMMKDSRFRHVHDFFAAFRVHRDAKTSRLYDTVGLEEVARVRSDRDIQLTSTDSFWKYLFGGTIIGTSLVFRLVALPWARRRFEAYTRV